MMLLSDDSMDMRLEILEELADVVSSFCLPDGLHRALGPALVAQLQASCNDSLAASAVTHAQSHDFICLHHAT